MGSLGPVRGFMFLGGGLTLKGAQQWAEEVLAETDEVKGQGLGKEVMSCCG